MKITQVASLYNIEIDSIKIVNGNVSYPIVLINKKYIIKRVASEMSINEVLFNTMRERGVLQNIVLNKYGRMFTYFDSCFWMVYIYHEGELFDHHNSNHMMKSMYFLKRIVNMTPNVGEIKFHDNFYVSEWYVDSKKMFLKTLELINRYYGSIENDYIEKLKMLIGYTSFSSEEFDRLQKTISHGEYQNTNILFSQDSIDIIDWDSLSIRPRIFDISTYLIYLCRKKRGSFKLDNIKIKMLLDYFELTDIEYKNLINMVFVNLVPREDKIEIFSVYSRGKLEWYLKWTVEFMEEVIYTLNKEDL
ncbi:phosphotransferase [Staphylococcus ursi]|uniref:phosphotransferase n=1 Tax=Staphylococcus sp. MI 10-1553 TaxID=1912064 RepID=UPI00139960FC|nr:phosphotransferase [Staphylococcus sp. MI 10-1553]QHW35921.1 phosphotransferase [Staphylococcus sp. MI 10-1553]